MNTWRALMAVIKVAGLAAAALLINWLLISQGVTGMITPEPKDVTENFMAAMAAERWEGALNELSEELASTVDHDDLRSRMQAFESGRASIEGIEGLPGQEAGDTAEAGVEITYTGQGTETIKFPLVREHGVWKIAALDALE